MGDSREHLCEIARSFYDRGYAFGSTGNISVRDGDRVYITPTGRSLGRLNPEDLAELDLSGTRLNDRHPSKETPFHLGMYRARRDARAIVHLHSTYSVALSCLRDVGPHDPGGEPLPALTPYYFMRVAPLGVLPYHRPGDPDLGAVVERAAAHHHCLLLRNHGSICAGTELAQAVDRIEELEATARLHFVLHGHETVTLTPENLEELTRVFVS